MPKEKKYIKTKIEKKILAEIEKLLKDDPINLHGRKKGEKPISPPYELDHHGQARAISEYLQGHIKYISELKQFAVYDEADGVYLPGDIAKAILWRVIEVLARARLDVGGLERAEADMATAFGIKMLEEKFGDQIMKLLKEKELLCSIQEFDADPLLLNCRGVVVDLRTGEQREATRDDRFLKTTAVKPENMPTPEFDKFMKWATKDRPDITAWLMRWFGYNLTGITTYEIFANFYGGGRNGKGTLIHLIQGIMGSDKNDKKNYQIELPLSAIVLEPNENRRPFDLANLPEMRMAVVSDVPKNTRFNIENVKKLTGNDVLRAEKKYCDSYQFQNTAKLTVCSNDEIRLPSTGPDMRDRLRLIPFNNYIAPENQDRKLYKKLFTEAPGVLYRLIHEAIFCVDDKEFPKCEAIDRATDDFFRKQDTVKLFCEDRLEKSGVGERIKAGDLYESYKSWCKDNGYKERSSRIFGEEVIKQYEKIKSGGVIWYQDIRIKNN